MAEQMLRVVAVWDDEAKVWVAQSDDVPGLATEAATPEALVAKLMVIIPELLEENDGLDIPEVPVQVLWETTQRIRLHG